MRITLISPRIAVQKGDFLGSGVPYWPVDLAVLAAFLRNLGDEVSVIDLFGSSPTTLEERKDHYLQGKPFQDFVDTPEVSNAEVFILYAMSTMSHEEILSIAVTIKKYRSETITAVLENSQAVTAYAINYAAGDFFKSNVDALLCGEVYWNWDEIIAFLKNPKKGIVPENVLVPDIVEGHLLRRKFNMHPSYPVPAWDLFNLKNYWSIPYSHGPKTKRYLPILTSRGCPYHCDFCITPETNNGRWRHRAPEEIVNEMISLRDRFGIRHFQIEDLNPTVDSSQWDKICRLLIECEAKISFYFTSGTKAETVRLDKVPLYARAGCRYISISPESGSPEVLRAMGKSFDYDHGLALIKACRKHKIYTQACLLVGHPAEKPKDHKLSCNYLRSMVRAGLDEIAIFVVAPLAGSKLYKQGNINLISSKTLMSFSPKGRQNWEILSQRRRELIKIFFIEKLKTGGRSLLLGGIRALLGTPRTKMENLPRRALFIWWLILKYRLHHLFCLQANKGYTQINHILRKILK